MAVLLADDELSPRDRSAYERHIASCGACRTRSQQAAREGRSLRAAFARPAAERTRAIESALRAVAEARGRHALAARLRPRRIAAWSMALTACAIAASLVYLVPLPALSDHHDLRVIVPEQLVAGSRTLIRVAVSDYHSGQPVVSQRVRLAAYEPGATAPRHVTTAYTDEFGVGALPLAVPDTDSPSLRLEVSADAVFTSSRAEVVTPIEKRAELLLTTDKPLYEPGETARIQARVLRVPSLEPRWGDAVSLIVLDPLGRRVLHHFATVDELGCARVSLPLAKEITYGLYRIRAASGDIQSDLGIQVRPYTSPELDVRLTLEEPILSAHGPVAGRVVVRYPYGKPATNLAVTIRAFPEGVDGLTRSVEPVAEKRVTTDASGEAVFTLGAVPAPGRLRVEAEAADLAGRSGSDGATCAIAADELRLLVVVRGGRAVPDLPAEAYVMTTLPDGTPARCSVAAQLIEQTDQGRKVTDLAALMTSTDGVGLIAFTPATGSPRLAVTATHPAGLSARTEVPIPTTADGGIALTTDKALYSVGETMTVTALKAHPGLLALDIVRDGRVLHTLTFADGPSAEAVIPVDRTLAGLLTLHGYCLNDPAVSGVALAVVEPKPTLRVALSSDKNVYAPGASARFVTRVENRHGVPVGASLSLVGLDTKTAEALKQSPRLAAVYFAMASGRIRLRDGAYAEEAERLLYEMTARPELSGKSRRAEVLLAASTADPPVLRGEFDPAAHAYQRALVRHQGRLRMAMVAAAGWLAAMLVWGVAMLSSARGADDGLSWRERLWLPSRPCALIVLAVSATAIAHVIASSAPFALTDGSMLSGVVKASTPTPARTEAAAPRVSRVSPGDARLAGIRGLGAHALSPRGLPFEQGIATDSSGSYRCTVLLAAEPMSYLVSALAISPSGEMGWAETKVKVGDDLLIDLAKPDSPLEGQIALLGCALTNTSDRPRRLRIEPRPLDWVVSGTQAWQEIEIPPHDKAEVAFAMSLRERGTRTLGVSVTEGASTRAAEARLDIRAPGTVVSASASGELVRAMAQPVHVPPTRIGGTERVELILYPGVAAHAYGALEWAESVESAWASSSYGRLELATTLRSIMRAEGASGETESRADALVVRGFQALLARRPGLGTGRPDTALTVEDAALELQALDRLLSMGAVAPELVDEARRRLLAFRALDGSFAGSMAATALAGWALSSSRGSTAQPTLQYIADRAEGIRESYTLALAANALASSKAFAPQAKPLLGRLANTAVLEPPGTAPWDAMTTTMAGLTGDAADVETAALVVLAMDAYALYSSGDPAPAEEELFARIRCAARATIVGAKTLDGAWATHHLSAVALRALDAARPGTMGGEAKMTVSVDGREIRKLSLDNRHAARPVIVRLDEFVHPGTTTVRLSLQGEGQGDYLITKRYNVL